MPVEIYGLDVSPPCRTVLMVANHLGIEHRFIKCDLQNGENKTPEFTKINPSQSIPAMKDGDLGLGESRAIISYLANGSSLYPSDIQTKAKIDLMLYFDLSLYNTFGSYIFPVVFGNESFSEVKKDKVVEVIKQLETILSTNKFAAGPDITIVDHSLIVTITTIKSMDIVDFSKLPKVEGWLTECKSTIPKYEELSGQHIDTLVGFFKSKLKEKGL